MKHAVITVAVDLVGSVRRKAKTMGASEGGGKVNAVQTGRWVILLMILGSTLVVAVWGLLAGFSDFMYIRQNSFVLKSTGVDVEYEIEEENPECQGRRVYMYDIPSQFNEGILSDFCEEQHMWLEMCESYINDGLGLKMEHVMGSLPFYRTEQFAVEVIVHERAKHYPCLTKNADSADLFYLPYYVGLDVSRFLFSSEVQLRDVMSQRFLGWLMAQPSWNRLQGNKHFMVLGRIVWDFSRQVQNVDWGNSLLSSFELQNVTKLLIERDPRIEKQMGIPYPTSFHPKSDLELQLWQKKVATTKRDTLVSFAGAPRNRTKHPEAALRDILFEQCSKSDNCTLLLCTEVNCPKNPHYVFDLFVRSTFCFQPAGDSPTRKAVFDCLVAGTIPVFFTKDSAYTQYLWHLPADGDSYSILFNETEVIQTERNMIEALQRIPEEKVRRMQDVIVNKILPSIVYDMPSRDPHKKVKDAFDIILDNILDPNFETYSDLAVDNAMR